MPLLQSYFKSTMFLLRWFAFWEILLFLSFFFVLFSVVGSQWIQATYFGQQTSALVITLAFGFGQSLYTLNLCVFNIYFPGFVPFGFLIWEKKESWSDYNDLGGSIKFSRNKNLKPLRIHRSHSIWISRSILNYHTSAHCKLALTLSIIDDYWLYYWVFLRLQSINSSFFVLPESKISWQYSSTKPSTVSL